MLGKILDREEILSLKEGDKVWLIVSGSSSLLLPHNELVTIKYNDTSGTLSLWSEDGYYVCKTTSVPLSANVYEWIEDTNEQTITEEINQPKTYKGSEILAMIENSELKDEDMIIDKDNYPWIIKNFTIEDDEECNPAYTLLNYAPFTIKEQKPVDFMTAYNSHKKVKPEHGEYIYSDMSDYLKVIESSTQSIADVLVNGRWLIQE